jgi:TP901 family phage tail tape measure protein
MSNALARLHVLLTADSAELEASLKKVSGTIAETGEKLSKMGQTLSTRVTAPLMAMGGVALKMGGDFESSMNQVRAVTGATGDTFDQLKEQAKLLGSTTQFSASQAADAMYFLASAGFETADIMGAMPGVLQLAAAANMDLARATDIASNILSGYGMEAEELARVNDVLVKTFQRSNVNVEMLGESMKFAAPVAKAAGIEFEEAAALLGLFGNAGIQGSMAGTALRGTISRLLNPVGEAAKVIDELGIRTKDSAGNLVPFEDLMGQLEARGITAEQSMRLFGQEAGPAMMSALSQGSGALRSLSTELRNSGGTAESVASVQMEGFNGSLKNLKSAFEGLMIAIAESGLGAFAESLVRHLTNLISKMASLDPVVVKVGVVIAGLTASIGPLLLVVGKLMTFVPTLVAGFVAVKGALATVVGVMAALNPIGLAVLATVAALTAAWLIFGDAIKGFIRPAEEATGWFANVRRKIAGEAPGVTAAAEEMFSGVAPAAHAAAEDADGALSGIAGGRVSATVRTNIADNVITPLAEGAEEAAAALKEAADRAAAAAEAVRKYDQALIQGASLQTLTGREMLELQARTTALAATIAGGQHSLEERNQLTTEYNALEKARLDVMGVNRDTLRQLSGDVMNVSKPIVGMTTKLTAMTETVDHTRSGFTVFTDSVKDAGEHFAGELKNTAMSVVAKFTPMGIATEILSRLMTKLQPAIQALEKPLEIVSTVLASALMPILKALFPVFKMLAISASYAGEILFKIAQGIAWVVGNVIKAIGVVISKIPFMGKIGDSLKNFGQGILDVGEGFGDAAKGLKEGRDEIRALQWPTEELEQQTAAIEASGDDIVAAIYDTAPSAAMTPTGMALETYAAGATITIGDINVDATGAQDPNAVGVSVATVLMDTIDQALGYSVQRDSRLDGDMVYAL